MTSDGGATIEGVKTIALYLAETAKSAAAGSAPAEKALVDQWLSFAVADLRPALLSKNTKVVRDNIRALNEHLLSRTFVALDAQPSLADVVTWANLHAYMVA